MRRAAVLLCIVVGCGGDDEARGDAAVPFDSAPAVLIDAPLPPADAAEPSLGQLCATGAVDGGAGSCTGSVCCSTGGTTRCTLPDDCPTGGGYKACAGGGECQGGICCRVSAMQFCTKSSACSAYGGTEVP